MHKIEYTWVYAKYDDIAMIIFKNVARVFSETIILEGRMLTTHVLWHPTTQHS